MGQITHQDSITKKSCLRRISFVDKTRWNCRNSQIIPKILPAALRSGCVNTNKFIKILFCCIYIWDQPSQSNFFIQILPTEHCVHIIMKNKPSITYAHDSCQLNINNAQANKTESLHNIMYMQAHSKLLGQAGHSGASNPHRKVHRLLGFYRHVSSFGALREGPADQSRCIQFSLFWED